MQSTELGELRQNKAIFNAIPIDSWIISMLVCPFLPVTENPIIGYNAYFPLFNWAMYPTLGYFIGISLKNSTDKTKLYKKATISGALLIALGFVGYAAMDVDNSVINALACSEDCYYMPNIFSACTAVGVIFILAAITHFFVRKKESLPKAITWGSKNIMKIYVFQWLAIGLTTPLYTEQSTWFVFIAAFVVTGLAAILTALWNMALANDEALRQM